MNTKVKKSSIILMILLIFTISLGAISAADSDSADESLNQAEDIGLEEAQSDIDESQDILTATDVNKTFTDFNTDITDKTEVDLESNYVYSDGDTAYKNGFAIDRELTINGNGQTLNPNGNLLFNIGSSGKLTLNDLTIVNSYTSTDAMIKNSGNLILNNITFTVERHILSSATSGAKFITIQNDGEMTVNNSNFINSLIYSDHISSTSKQINIYGLIYNNNKITIENTVFDGNKLVNPSENKLGRTIDICAVLHNTNNMLLNNVVISNTNVNYVPSGNPHFEGIIFNEKGKLEINGSTIKNNHISFSSTNSNFKGVIYSEATTSELIMSNSIIVDNENTNDGTGKQIVEYKGTADINNNYWGTNNPNFNDLVTGTAPASYVSLTFNPEEATAGEEKTFDIAFKVNDETITTLPNYTVAVNSNKLGPQDVEIKNGVGQYKYLPIIAGEDTITINGEEYTITVNASPAGTFTDLNALIIANDGVELYRDYVYQSSDSALQTGIPINKNVTINGNGYTINSTNLARLFTVAANCNLTLRNVTLITDFVIASSATSNGNILNKGNITFEDVTFTSKRVSRPTGDNAIAPAILNDAAGIITIKNSRFIDSISNYTGTSTVMPYGLIYNKGTMIIQDSLFANNGVYSKGSSLSTQNGILYNTKILNMTNTTFENNFITYEGTGNSMINGIVHAAVGTIASIDNCTFKENVVSSKSTGTGATYIAFGTLCIKGGTVTVTNSNFIKNSAWTGSAIAATPTSTLTFTSENNTFIENSNNYEGANPEGGCGGAIYVNYRVIFNSVNDKFINNSAVKGGAIYARTYVSGTTATPADVTVTNAIFEGNTATTGSAIYRSDKTTANNNYWGTNSPEFNVLISDGTDSLTPDNYVIMKIEGQSVVLPESQVTYTINFKSNDTDAICELPDYTIDLSATNALSDYTVTISKGSASFTYFATLNEIEDTIKASSDSVEKASLDVIVSEDPTAEGTFKELDRFIRKADSELDLIKDYTFDAIIDAGLENGIVIDKTLTINGHGFKINSTDLAKLFSITSTGNLTLKDVTIVTDYAATGTYSSTRAEASIKNLGILNFDNVTFTLNQNVTSTAGALAAGIYNTNTFNIVNSKFVDSNVYTTTSYYLGLIDNNGGTLTVENTIFNGNSFIDNSTSSSLYFDGLIYNMGTLTFENVNVTNNYMETPSNSRGLIRTYTNSKNTINNSRFENNTLNSTANNAQGTVIFAEAGTLTITNSEFINNTGARSGGALYIAINPTLVNNTFEKNVATESGGAIYLASGASQPVFINNTFKENKAMTGGAIYSGYSLQSSKSYNFTANTFIANEATKNGGAVYAASIGSNTYPVENNVFINNKAGEKGGAIYSTGTLKITKTIFQGNEAGEGAVIYTTKTTASTITYSIFDNNVVNTPTGTLIYYYGSSTADYNYWGTNTPDFDAIIAVNGGTKTIPTNIVIITIEGNEIISSSDNYIINFKDNVTGDIVQLHNYEVNITSDLNTVTPTSVVIADGEATFTYNAENHGTDTIRVMKDNVEITSFDVTVSSSKQTPEFTIVANDVNYGDALNLTFTVIAGPTGENIYKWTIFSKNGLL
ncbi:beta strand repeat-containing protein, partial [Methanobrevibacter sp.]|uniref:beta strand repeat-containing protein n=1 Tax=Methanobrevibacter sp. TaxID=66852 RepID=UPI0038639212